MGFNKGKDGGSLDYFDNEGILDRVCKLLQEKHNFNFNTILNTHWGIVRLV